MPSPIDIRTGQPLDYAEPTRFVRPLRSDNIARIMGDPDELIDLYRAKEEAERIERLMADIERDARVHRWQVGIAVGCYVIAVLSAMYFAFQIGRAL